jgi:suppressor of G2 allele of SKP1
LVQFKFRRSNVCAVCTHPFLIIPQIVCCLVLKMNYEFSQTEQTVHLKVVTYELKAVNVTFSEDAIKIETTFKNRIPENETFHFELKQPIDPALSKHSFTKKWIFCELAKVHKEAWTSCEIKSTSNISKRPTKRYRNSSDWDRLVKEEQETEEESNKNQNDVFQDLYACSDENAKRAMMKSFTESNGTVLSMNWSEVGKDRVKPYDS